MMKIRNAQRQAYLGTLLNTLQLCTSLTRTLQPGSEEFSWDEVRIAAKDTKLHFR